jgi:L-arabinose isomerase
MPSKPRIGLVALTLELYEQLLPALREDRERWLRAEVLPRLGKFAEVQFDRAVYTREGIEAAVRSFEAGGVDALMVICLTYSPSQLALPALQRTRLPILVWNTQELMDVGSDFDAAKMVANHGVHGTQDLASVLVQHGVDFEYITSHPSDREGLEKIGHFCAAAAAVAGLRRVRVGLLGYPFPGMGDFAVDTSHIAATLGCQWTAISVEEYILRAAAALAPDVTRIADEYRAQYDVAPDVTDADLEAAARAELALRAIIEERYLDAFSYQFMAFGEDERSETLPFVAASRLMAEGIGFAGEGDMMGAIGTWLLGRLQPPATFSEVFTIDFAGNGLFMSHMGEANVRMARRNRRVPLVARPQPITRTRGRQLALVTSLQPGPGTLLALCRGPNQRWRLIASRVEIDDYGPLPDMPVPHFKVRPVWGDVRDLLTAYAKAGGPHHNAVCFGDATPRIRAAAKLLGADYCELVYARVLRASSVGKET